MSNRDPRHSELEHISPFRPDSLPWQVEHEWFRKRYSKIVKVHKIWAEIEEEPEDGSGSYEYDIRGWASWFVKPYFRLGVYHEFEEEHEKAPDISHSFSFEQKQLFFNETIRLMSLNEEKLQTELEEARTHYGESIDPLKPYNDLQSKAIDWQLWSSLDNLTFKQAGWLSLGRDPTWMARKDVLASLKETRGLSPGVDHMIERLLKCRQIERGSSNTMNRDFNWWADRLSKTGVELANDAKVTVEPSTDAQKEIADLKVKLDKAKKEIERLKANQNPDSRDPVGRMLLSLALVKFNFDPNAPRNTATGSIKDATEQAGLSVDQGTIKRHLDRLSKHFEVDNSIKNQ